MITRQAQEYAAHELKRRLAPRHGLAIGWVVLWTPLLWMLSALLGASALLFNWPFRGQAWNGFGFGFALGAVLFLCFPCRPLYVLGHELTHWLAAKITFHKTGKLRVGLRQGSIDIPKPTLFIVLAPYIIPFYLLISLPIIAILAACWSTRPAAFSAAAGAWLGLCGSYHIVLTILALTSGQRDLDFRGPVLSYSFIVFGNLLVLFLALVLLSRQWRQAWELPWHLLECCFLFLHEKLAMAIRNA